MIHFIIIVLFLGALSASDFQPSKSDLNSALRMNGNYKVWVFFEDKELNKKSLNFMLNEVSNKLHYKTKKRRSKVRSSSMVDIRDIPVSRENIEEIQSTGAIICMESKWLNAVSISASFEQISAMSNLFCVKNIIPVRRGKRKIPNQSHRNFKLNRTTQIDYGESHDQLDQINVIDAHSSGYTGQGIRILILDTGYLKDHEAIPNDQIVGEWDFVNNDGETQNEDGDPVTQHKHGTQTLSILGGRIEGTLYGSAYESEFLLGKTEDESQENPIEEDWYVAGLEWGEENGAEIVSSSLGYIDWYSQEDLNGTTAIITLAVNTAIENGMVVVTAVGNSGSDGIVAPADAFNVIACGAVNLEGNIAPYSSNGPTSDGRIKPEVCARGVNTFCAGVSNTSAYGYENGTSFSTPLVAGAVACILQAHPDWTPEQIREALLETASNSNSPDNQYGWGIINVEEAIDYTFSNNNSPMNYSISNIFPNPFNHTTHFSVNVYQTSNITLKIFDIYGREIEIVWSGVKENREYQFHWNANGLASGIFFVNLQGANGSITKKMCLLK